MHKDIAILRPLAAEYFCAAQSEQNDRRRVLHRAVNDLKMIRPVVLIDEIPFHELNFDGSLTLQCQNEVFRAAEWFFRRQLFQWKHFPADMILTPYYPVAKVYTSTGIGIEVEEETLAKDKNNNIISHRYIDKIATEEDLERIKMPVLSYDEAATKQTFEQLANAFGDLLPVKIVGHNSYLTMWDQISRYRGVTPLLMDLAMRPDFSHKVVKKFADIAMSTSEQMEDLGLYEAHPISIHCTCALNSLLPQNTDGTKVKRSQIWGRGMAQIFASVSSDMHKEFEMEYMKQVMAPFGLLYYGCCEPLDKKMDLVEQLPHIHKISVTPWADVNVAAEAIGKKYVLASKPNPAAVSTTLDEDALRKELSNILAACKKNGCSCDIVLKDISSAGYNLNNLVRWEQIAMELVESY